MSGKLGVVGAHGRLGRSVVRAATAAGWRLTLSATRDEWNESERPDVVVDVSHRSAVSSVAAYCARSQCALLEAVSGLEQRDLRALATASDNVPLAIVPNLSHGHYLQSLAVAAVVRAVADDAGWSVSVAERHPTTKSDRPSATARELRRRCSSLGIDGAEIVSLREGAPVSDHWVSLTRAGETVTLMHAVTDLGAAADGALKAAGWLVGAETGLWSMQDVWQSVSVAGSCDRSAAHHREPLR